MGRYRNALPQLDGSLFLTGGESKPPSGLRPVPPASRKIRNGCFPEILRTYSEIAARFDTGPIVESAT
jgi:hypothetical protein